MKGWRNKLDKKLPSDVRTGTHLSMIPARETTRERENSLPNMQGLATVKAFSMTRGAEQSRTLPYLEEMWTSDHWKKQTKQQRRMTDNWWNQFPLSELEVPQLAKLRATAWLSYLLGFVGLFRNYFALVLCFSAWNDFLTVCWDLCPASWSMKWDQRGFCTVKGLLWG